MTGGMARARRGWAGLAAVLVLAFGAGVWLRTLAPVGTDLADRAWVGEIMARPGYPAAGPADADVTVMVFTDYQCSACRAAHPALLAAARKDGRVRIVWRDWPVFGDRSVNAARIALGAADQGIYSALHDRLMRDPRRLDPAELARQVTGLGADWDAAARRGAGAGVAALLDQTHADAARLGLRGTPGFLIGPVLVLGALDEGGFARAFARARKAARADR